VTSVAVIGLGVIGKAQAVMFGESGVLAWGYDPRTSPFYPESQIGSCDFAVICVGTPEGPDGRADLKAVYASVQRLSPAMPILVRSTLPPGTTDRLQAGRTGLVAHAPEFMHERKGGEWARPTDVPFLILGGTEEAHDFFRPHLSGLFPKIHECTALVAEFAKYVVNCHLATRITFINEMARISVRYGVNWEDIRAAWLNDPRITPEYTSMEGFGPGFGGRCWPKDLAAIIAAAGDAGYDPGFLKAVQEANARFRSD
jgi:nucleotide sugar dehydrogenase